MRLFDIDEVPEVPLLREPRRSRGENDARFRNDYPPEWDRCPTCEGTGRGWVLQPSGVVMGPGDMTRIVTTYLELPDGVAAMVGDSVLYRRGGVCPDCLGMGSQKRKARLLAGFRCERCRHPYLGKGDMKQLGKVELASHHVWSPCDEECVHGATFRWRIRGQESWLEVRRRARSGRVKVAVAGEYVDPMCEVEAEWRILTVHHLDGDKANLAWWNLATLCQRCHLEIQAKVVMERVYQHEHSEWFKPHAAGYYASVYLCAECALPQGAEIANHRGDGDGPLPLSIGPVNEHGFYPHPFKAGLQLTLEETLVRMDELLALEAA